MGNEVTARDAAFREPPPPMHLYSFLVVVVSLSCGSLPDNGSDPARAWLATAGMVVGWVLLAHVGARMIANHVRRGDLDPRDGADWLDLQLEAFRWLGLGVSVLCLGGFGIGRGLGDVPLLADAVCLQGIILLAPAILITAGTWSAEHRYAAMLGYTEPGITNHLSSVGKSLRGSMAWLVVPILVLLAGGDLLRWLPIDAAWTGWISAALLLLFIPLGLPWLIRYLFKTSRLSDEDARWVGDLMSAAGLRGTRAVRWETDGRQFNALVAGFVPPFRTLLISDRLVEELPRDQMAMVILHEAAHLRRRHVPIRMLSVLPAWLIGAAITRLAGDETWAVAAGSFVGILITMLALRWVAMRTEFDADKVACRMATNISGGVPGVPVDGPTAAESLSAALMRVTRDHPASRKATWLHPGVGDRIDRMRRAFMAADSVTSPTMPSPAEA